jgi:secreted PhoX family phosphatase
MGDRYEDIPERPDGIDEEPFTRRHVLEGLTAAGLLALGGAGTATAGDGEGHHDPEEPTLNRFATTVYGAEITGLFLTRRGNLFLNVQHPGGLRAPPGFDNEEPYDTAAVGALTGFNMHDLPYDFASVPTPQTPREGGEVRTAVGDHQVLANGRSRTTDGSGERLGVVYDPDGDPLTSASDPDYNGYVPDPDRADVGYLFSNWESRPGLVSRLTIERGNRGGDWRVLRAENIDFRGVEGTWNNCFGTVSPWGTPLSGEEAEPDAAGWADSSERATYRQYLGHEANPYRYGHIVELTDPTGDPSPVKRFAMGRCSHENCVVMPDERTVYLSDDGSNGQVFFKFVADRPGDLSAGTLYAARARQGSGRRPGEVGFLIDWIELAHATGSAVADWIADYDGDPDETTYISDAEVRRWANGNAADDRVAFLESRAAAAAAGATAEFNKMEGVNVKRDAEPGDYLYMAMSRINEGEMADGTGDIRVAPNSYGVVYRLPLEGDYNVSYMEPAVAGGPDATVCGGCPYDARPGSGAEVCADCSFNPAHEDGLSGRELLDELLGASRANPDNTIANPDNIVVMDDGRVIIGEDTVLHRNNMVWVFNPGEEAGRTDDVPGRAD